MSCDSDRVTEARCRCMRCVAPPIKHYSILTSIPHFPLMSHIHPISTPSNFQLIFDNALNAYKRRTKIDLFTHPLADRLEPCDSASSILIVLHEHVQELNQSQLRNETWIRWLDPSVKVLHAFSEILGRGLTLVSFNSSTCQTFTLSYLFDRHFHQQNPSLLQSESSFQCVSYMICSCRPS